MKGLRTGTLNCLAIMMILILDMLRDNFKIRLEIAITKYSKTLLSCIPRLYRASAMSLYSALNALKYSNFLFRNIYFPFYNKLAAIRELFVICLLLSVTSATTSAAI